VFPQDLAVKMIEGLARIESKVDSHNQRADKHESRIDNLENRVGSVERRQNEDGSFRAGLAAGQKRVMSWVSFGWITVSSTVGILGGALAHAIFSKWLG
jgi:hypothetical protein